MHSKLDDGYWLASVANKGMIVELYYDRQLFITQLEFCTYEQYCDEY